MKKACIGFALVLSLLAGLPAKASEPAAYRKLNLTLAERHVIPRYEMLAGASAALNKEATAFCAAPGADNLLALKAAFATAQDAWIGVQHLRFGPVQFLLRYDRFAFWPDQRNTGGRHLARLLTDADPKALEAPAFARGSVAVQGLTALERLLYGKDTEPAGFAGNDGAAFRCGVVTAIAANLARMSEETLEAWRGGDTPYRDLLARPGEDNPYYLDDKEVALEFFKAFNGGLEMIADLKLARPLGGSLEKSKPRRSEAWRSGRALDNIAANLTALEELYRVGFADFVAKAAKDAALDRALRARFASSLAAVAAIDKPLAEAVADPGSRPRVETLLTEVKALKDLSTGRLAAALDLQLGFNAFDGD